MKFHLALATAAIALLTALTPIAHAQQPPPEMAAEAKAFEKSLGVTPDQKKKLENVGKKYAPKIKAIMEKLKKQGGAKPTPQLQQKLMKQWSAESGPLMAAQRKEQEAILTPAQLAKIKAFQAKMMAKMKAGGGKG